MITKTLHDIYIWGCGHYGVLTVLDLENKGIKIKGFIDKNAKEIKMRLNFPVFTPDKILSKKLFVIIAVQNRTAIEEIIEMLSKAGLKKNKNFEISHLVGYKENFKPIQIAPIDTTNLTSYDTNLKKETKNPIVRVFLLTYNHVSFIRPCLNGILMQKTDFPFEIYIYDDCSTDGTSDIIREYADKYSNIIVDIQSENYYSKNYKLWIKKQCKVCKNHDCKYVASVEGDDYWTDVYKLQLQVNFLDKHDDFSVCSGGYLTSNSFNGMQETKLLSLKNSIGIEFDFSNLNFVYVKTHTLMYRTDAIAEYEIAKKYNIWQDVHLRYYALQRGKGYYFSRIFGVYNIHSNGISSGLTIEQRAEKSYKVYQEFYNETKDKHIKLKFINSTLNFLDKCLKTKEQRIIFIKNFAKRFPELSKEFKAKLKSAN